jgi:hypothetical protein
MVPKVATVEKFAALRAARSVNSRPEAVMDPLFTAGVPFFDARDLVQVKYEMLRRVRTDGWPITRAASTFGFCRTAFYRTQAAWDAGGLPGLLPNRPGPHGGSKLTAQVVELLGQMRVRDPTARPRQLALLLRSRLRLVVHPRSIERALAGRGGKGSPTSPCPTYF